MKIQVKPGLTGCKLHLKMSRKILVHYKTFEKRNSDVEEVEVNDAMRIIKEAQALGQIVFDKQNGMVIDFFHSNLKEIVIVEVVEGG